MGGSGLREISLFRCEGTTVSFEDATFTIRSRADEVRISRDSANYAVLTESTESIPYESSVAATVTIS
jgi:hypothetical protein